MVAQALKVDFIGSSQTVLIADRGAAVRRLNFQLQRRLLRAAATDRRRQGATMVQYEGHVTRDGELVVNLEGNMVSLREFLQATRLRSQRKRSRVEDESRRLTANDFAVAK